MCAHNHITVAVTVKIPCFRYGVPKEISSTLSVKYYISRIVHIRAPKVDISPSGPGTETIGSNNYIIITVTVHITCAGNRYTELVIVVFTCYDHIRNCIHIQTSVVNISSAIQIRERKIICSYNNVIISVSVYISGITDGISKMRIRCSGTGEYLFLQRICFRLFPASSNLIIIYDLVAVFITKVIEPVLCNTRRK